MVHALHEAARVLKPNGLLLDLRPAPVHRRVGVLRADHYQPLGRMREQFDEDYAANRAVAEVVRQGVLRIERRVRFDFDRTMDSPAEFRTWLADFASLGRIASHDWLVRRVDRAFSTRLGENRLVVRGPLDLRLLRKPDSRL
jgi:hypothetical protein